MTILEQCRVYEQEAVWQVTGPAIRPGGLELTRRLVVQCDLPPQARVLDVGCGMGATVEQLQAVFGLKVIGLDLSPMLLQAGRARRADLSLLQSPGERLPLAAGQFEAVLAECSLSVMVDPARALAEFRRMLRPGGRLMVSDVYARNPAAIPVLRRLPLHSCLSGAMSRPEIEARLVAAEFRLLDWQDHTAALTYFAGQLILAHGSLAAFWGCVAAGQVEAAAIQQAVRLARPGYYGLIAATKE